MNAADIVTDVWLPWRPKPSRVPAFNFCVQWWESNGYTVHTVDSGDEPFSLAATRNLAVQEAQTLGVPAVIIADADTIGDTETIQAAVTLTQTEQRTYLPYTQYRSLGDLGTAQALAGTNVTDCHHWHYPYGVSGIYITTPNVWNTYGGQDPRFKGWGGEDIAHMHAHETLIGPIGRTEGNVYALGHDSEDKEAPQNLANFTLMREYGEANGNPELMRQLVGQALAAL